MDAAAYSEIEPFALEEFLPYRLSLLSNTVSRGISAAYRKRYGLSVTEWRVVAILGRFPGLTASEVTARGVMDKVAVSRAVNKLLERDMVERTPHSEDRRRMPLRLTRSRGLALYREVVPKALAYERALLDALSETERTLLDRLIEKLQDAADGMNEA